MNWLCWELRWQISSISYRFQDKLNWKGQLVPIGGWNRIISTFELSYFSSNLNAVFLQDVHFHDQALSQYRKKWAIFFMENRLYWAQSKKFHIFHLIIFLITFPACVFQSDLTKPVIMVYKIKRCWMGPRLKIEKKTKTNAQNTVCPANYIVQHIVYRAVCCNKQNPVSPLAFNIHLFYFPLSTCCGRIVLRSA